MQVNNCRCLLFQSGNRSCDYVKELSASVFRGQLDVIISTLSLMIFSRRKIVLCNRPGVGSSIFEGRYINA